MPVTESVSFNAEVQRHRYKRSISRPEIVVLGAISILIHGLLWWSFNRQPLIDAEVLPNQASSPSQVTLSLSAAPPPPPQPTPRPPQPQVEDVPIVDENAVMPAETEPEPKPEPEPEPQPEPEPEAEPEPQPEPEPEAEPEPQPEPEPETEPEPQPEPEPETEPEPRPKPEPSPRQSAPTQSASSPSQAGQSTNAVSSNRITPAVSGMQSLGNPPPHYPSLALRRGYEGNVQLKILVMPDGRAGQVQVMQSSGHRELDEAAVETVKTWKFKPARRGDTPIKGWALQTIAFQLPN